MINKTITYRVTVSDILTKWHLNGQLHREDGPAVEHTEGHKEWYLKGDLHREDGPAVEYVNGDKAWYINNKLHREGGPAIESLKGNKEWFLHGKLHREEGPALVNADGYKAWYINGKRHREDGPAIEYVNGRKEWYLNGVRQPDPSHPLAPICDKIITLDGHDYKLVPVISGASIVSQTDIPPDPLRILPGQRTIITLGHRTIWRLNDNLHREDGPALEFQDGHKEWYLNDYLHREDGPAVEYVNGDKEWWLRGAEVTEEEHLAQRAQRYTARDPRRPIS